MASHHNSTDGTVITPFGPLKTPHGADIIQLRPRHSVGRGRELAPWEPRRNLPVANDRFEPEWDPLPWDDGITGALDRDARDYELIAIVGGLLVLLLGIVAWAFL